jgi:hypothetical protein
MTRTTATQAMTNVPENLVIGLPQMRAAEISNIDTTPVLNDVSGTPSPDSATSPLSENESLGSIKEGGLTTEITMKEHGAGYPVQTDFTIVEATNASYNVTVEEFIDNKGKKLIDNILDTLETGTQHFYAIESLAMFQNGDTGSIYTPAAVLKPELNLSASNDWLGLPVSFDALYRNNFTNNKLFYWKKDSTPTSRDRTNMPLTLNPGDLLIGEMQFRVGRFATRDAGLGVTYPARKVVGVDDTLVTSGGTYTGGLDGAFIISITTGGADGTAAYTLTDLEGNVSSPVTIPVGGGTHTIGVDVTTSSLTSSVGVTITFAAGTYTLDDVYVIGVASPDEVTGDQTNIFCPYPYLPATTSIGSIVSTNASSDISYKDHTSGYPQVKDSSIVESTSIKFGCSVEEFNMTESNFATGRATTLVDAMFDSARSGNTYIAPLEVLLTSATGKVFSFWIANASLTPNASFAPSNDWANSPIEFVALAQSGISGSKRVQTLLRA